MSETAAPVTLRTLIDKALVKWDTTSVNQLARIGEDAGYSITQTTLAQILAGTYKWRPKLATLDAIAYLAGVSLAEAHRAAGLKEPGVPYEPPPGADRLTPKEREAVNGVIRALLAARDRTDG